MVESMDLILLAPSQPINPDDTFLGGTKNTDSDAWGQYPWIPIE